VPRSRPNGSAPAPRAPRVRSGAAAPLRVPFTPPLDLAALLGFFAVRAIPGVESVTGGCYVRTVRLPGVTAPALLSVARAPRAHALLVRCEPLPARSRAFVAASVNRLFRAVADPTAEARLLSRDPLLAPVLSRHAGLRVPGAWDPFEVAVRAILGQQVSVAGAATLARRLAERFGEPLPARLAARAAAEGHALVRLFPTAHALAAAGPEAVRAIGLPGARARSLHGLAQTVAEGRLDLARLQALPLGEAVAALDALPGIGPWTAHYLALRALPHTDAFPEGDLVLLKALRRAHPEATMGDLLQRAERWRPHRALATIALWVGETERGPPGIG
jgi:AraC family transcriptional regulator of adaptative response / DNA-3-methyladenine glycosylase II